MLETKTEPDNHQPSQTNQALPKKKKQRTASPSKTSGHLDGPQPHTPEQDLTHFGSWEGDTIWVPPKDSSDELAKSILNKFGLFASKKDCWNYVTKEHRDKFTQVRRLSMPQASIRLPEGSIFVTVTEPDQFDQIEEEIPRCVQTRLDEFMAGPGQQRGVKVRYLKPLLSLIHI